MGFYLIFAHSKLHLGILSFFPPFFSWHPAAAASGELAPPKWFGLLKFPCVLFWPMWPAWKARQGGGRVNVSYTRLLMRPETKERADTIMWLCAESLIYILPGDSWRYGDVGGVQELRGAARQQPPKKKKEMSWFSAWKHLSRAEIISPVEI